ncbi:hypothetical protein BBK36DRAFT_1121605 [Trichoderma citrinoviride]|uniref:F-box domain-containing protein n=1 Tax=Trichoderma citrinoviride TaxID=58853 RepID=A0A2T4B7V8_9HYPO|nr:hypothetical protein BBK36DRAFT_1121605 [Trichoderma citrinoviride]PTB65407.1 hypothetical protein BBK36DRAFT_1121605 [Trichoderma citrinoviride]
MDDASAPAEARRLSIEKVPIVLEAPPPFDGLPDEIIEQILLATDPNGFASLMTLNRKWRDVSQRPHLYRYHLARCPTYAANPASLPSADTDNLPRLRQLFAREIKRNLFASYVRPTVTLVKLVSKAISSSSCPGGEGMGFTTSPNGHYVLAYNSSRMYLINASGSSIEMKREFKMLRRPVSACVSNDATLLAVLSTEMQVDIYDLKQSPPKRKQSMILDNNPRTIALSPCGTVLTAAYDGGIEVQALSRGASPTERRAVKCDAVDALAFSFDGTQILGTTLHSSPPSTVVITAPYYDPGALSMEQGDENLSAMWTTSILFPNSSRDCSHAVLLQDGSQEEAAWAFAYDRTFETFRAVRIDDLRNGTTHFTGPVPKSNSQAKLLPCTLPSATYHGELVSACFHGSEVWIYGVPEDLAAVPETSLAADNASGLARRNSAQSHSSRSPSTRTQEVVPPTDGTARVPQWQILCDKLRNHFVAGHKTVDFVGVNNVKWVSGFGDALLKERLIVTAPGVVGPRLVTEDEDMDFVDGGRIALVDFGYALTDGTTTEITIEVGTDDAEVLEEEQRDIETEVAIVRRRTVAQRGGRGVRRGSLVRTATIAVTPTSSSAAAGHNAVSPISPASTRSNEDDDPLVPRTMGRNPAADHRPAIREPIVDEEEFLSIEEQEAMDAPYAHSSPRSGTALRRAATVAAASRRLNPRTADGRPIEYRRADGRREHPHESDADNWEPPPPPYQAEDPGDAPAFLRGRTVLATVSLPGQTQQYLALPVHEQHPPANSVPPQLPSLVIPPSLPPVSVHGNSSNYHEQGGSSHARSASDSTIVSRLRPADEVHPPLSSTSGPLDHEDIYDVSPPASPMRARSRDSHSMAASQGFVTAQPTTVSSSTSMGVYESSPATVGPLVHPEFDFGSPGLGFESASSPIGRRLSNAQTWPLVSPSSSDDRHETASASTTEIARSSLPPAPSSDQMARLIRRVSQGNPVNLAGSLHSTQYQQLYRPQPVAGSLAPTPTNAADADIDQPLIISTPRGVGGAFDPPGRRVSRRGDTPIVAPVPRRPRATGGSAAPPTVERLETISTGGPQPVQQTNLVLPTWMRGPPASPGRQPSTVNRRPSRAERSAAKNMRDAKKRGWTAKKKKTKETPKPTITEEDHNGSIWMDMDVPHAKEHDKDKKCSVM